MNSTEQQAVLGGEASGVSHLTFEGLENSPLIQKEKEFGKH